MFIVNVTHPFDELQTLKDHALEYESSVDFLLEQSGGLGRERRGQILAKLARDGSVVVKQPEGNTTLCEIEVTEVRI